MKSKFAIALIAAALFTNALAQQPGATGGAVLACEQGKALVARARGRAGEAEVNVVASMNDI